jgi:hypothetical protein
LAISSKAAPHIAGRPSLLRRATARLTRFQIKRALIKQIRLRFRQPVAGEN